MLVLENVVFKYCMHEILPLTVSGAHIMSDYQLFKDVEIKPFIVREK